MNALIKACMREKLFSPGCICSYCGGPVAAATGISHRKAQALGRDG